MTTLRPVSLVIGVLVLVWSWFMPISTGSFAIMASMPYMLSALVMEHRPSCPVSGSKTLSAASFQSTHAITQVSKSLYPVLAFQAASQGRSYPYSTPPFPPTSLLLQPHQRRNSRRNPRGRGAWVCAQRILWRRHGQPRPCRCLCRG